MEAWQAIALLVCALLLASFAVFAFPSVEALCISPYGADYVQSVAEGQKLYVLWEYNTERSAEQGGDHYLQLAASTDGGATFGAPFNIHQTDPLCSLHPRLSADRQYVYVMWEDRENIHVRGSADSGMTFYESIFLGEGNIGDMGRVGPLSGGSILAKGDRAYAIWTGWDGIYFSRTDNGGESFSNPVNLSMHEASEPRITSDGRNVHVVWVQYILDERCSEQCVQQIMFTYSHDYGMTFSEPANLEELTGSSLSTPDYPVVSSHGDNVYLIWAEEYWNLYFAASNDGGKTFLEKQIITDFGEAESGYPVLFSAFEDKVYIGWQSREGRNALLESTDGSQEFAQVQSGAPADFAPPPGMLLMNNASQAYFMWPEYPERGQKDIMFASVLTDSEESPGPMTLARYASERSFVDLSMAASGDFVHVMWIESGGSQSGYFQQIIVMTSTDAGRSFGQAVEVASMVTVPEFGSVAAILMAAGIVGSIFAVKRLQQL